MLASAISLLSVISGFQNAVASICPPMCIADEDIAIEAQVENETMMNNQTADGNMTGTTSTNSTN
mgnify:CR=1 FL=1